MLLATHDHEHTDDELAEAVPTWSLILALLWLVPVLALIAIALPIALLLAPPKRLEEDRAP